MRKILVFLVLVFAAVNVFGIEWKEAGGTKFVEYVLNEEQSANAFKYVFENGYALNKINTDTTAYKVPENSIKMYLYNYSIGGNDTYSVVFIDNEAVYGIQLRNINEVAKKDLKKNKRKVSPSTAVDIAAAPSSALTYFVFGSTAGIIFDVCTTLAGTGLDNLADKQSKPSIYGPDKDFIEGLAEAAN